LINSSNQKSVPDDVIVALIYFIEFSEYFSP
jgi:hypothetical protein